MATSLKEFLRPVRPLIGPMFGLAAPVVRQIVRTVPSGPVRRRFWDVAGDQLSRGTWSFTTRSMYGFKLHGNTIDLLCRYVYYFGVWEPNLSTWIAKTLSAGDTFVDVGSNVGYHALLASRIVGPSGRVIAIEASPRIFAHLQHNVALNDASNVRCVNMAVADRDGELQLYDGPVGNSGKTSIVDQAGLTRSGTIAARPLPGILAEDELRNARLFKIDVEGAEWLVVSGLADALHKTRPDAEFVVELSPERLASFGRVPADVLTLFGQAGFNAYEIVHDYSSNSYLDREPYQAPRRVTHDIARECDVVFSRADRAAL